MKFITYSGSFQFHCTKISENKVVHFKIDQQRNVNLHEKFTFTNLQAALKWRTILVGHTHM